MSESVVDVVFSRGGFPELAFVPEWTRERPRQLVVGRVDGHEVLELLSVAGEKDDANCRRPL